MLKAEGLIPAARSSVWNGHFALRASAGHIQGAGRGRTGGTGRDRRRRTTWWWVGWVGLHPSEKPLVAWWRW